MFLHVLAILGMVFSMVSFFIRRRAAPPALRASAFRLLTTGVSPYAGILVLIAFVYAMLNFVPGGPGLLPGTETAIPGQGESTGSAGFYELRVFSAQWMVFFLAAAYIIAPRRLEASSGHDSQSKGSDSLADDGPSTSQGPGLRSVEIYSRRVEPLTMVRRVWSGAYGFFMAWTAFLSAAFAILFFAVSEAFLLIPVVMFAVVTFVNYRLRQHRMKDFLIAIVVDPLNLTIEYLEFDRRETLECRTAECGAVLKEEVVRGNSLFTLEIATPRGMVNQALCSRWPYEELEAIARAVQGQGTSDHRPNDRISLESHD